MSQQRRPQSENVPSGVNPSSSIVYHQAGRIKIGDPGSIFSVAFLDDGRYVVGSSWEGKIRRWRVEDGVEVGMPMDVGDTIRSIAVSHDGKWVMSGTESGEVMVWDAESQEKVIAFRGHTDSVCAVDISPDGTRIVTGSWDETACVWSLPTGQLLMGPFEHSNKVVGAKFSPDGCFIATATWDCDSVRLYHVQKLLLADAPIIVSSQVNQSLTWSNDSQQLFGLSCDGNVNCVDVFTRSIRSRWPTRIGGGPSDSQQLVVLPCDGYINCIDMFTGSIRSQWPTRGSGPSSIAIACNRTFIAVSVDSFVSFWDTTTHQQIGPVIQHTHNIESIAISANYDLAMGGDGDVTLHALWDILPSSYSGNISVERARQRMEVENTDLQKTIELLHAQIEKSGHEIARLEHTVQQLRDQLSGSQCMIAREKGSSYDTVMSFTSSHFEHDQPVDATVVGTSSLPLSTKKRIIICCDGTWQDGVVLKDRWRYTNVLRLSRVLTHHDERLEPAAPQIVFYQCGIGSSPNLYSEYVQGATEASLVEKVQEAYAFIAQNFHPGDEIFLFGFSRGAYTARMVAMLIGAIGVLDKTDMGHFADIFVRYQKLGKSDDAAEIARLQAELVPWTSPTSRGKLRAVSDDHTFSIKCVGVFDTVGSVGLPEEITRRSPSIKSVFGLPNAELGEHIERAYQALAINETRLGFNCNKFEQSQGGRRKGQILKQCWFAGEHSDIGGGWHDHDLSDLSLTWMVANIRDILAMDLKYIRSLPDTVVPWGKQPPHDSHTGIFALSPENTRQLPTRTDDITHETIHPSVLEQDHAIPQLREIIQKNPMLVCNLLPLEEEIKRNWPFVPERNIQTNSKGSAQVESATIKTTLPWNATKEVLGVGTKLGTELVREARAQETTNQNINRAPDGRSSATSWLMSLAHEILRAVLGLS